MNGPRVYPARILGVHDGDNVLCELDRGTNDYSRWSIRLIGGNAREMSMPGGPEARAHLLELAAPAIDTGYPSHYLATVISVRWDKFGNRLDGFVEVPGVPDLMTQMIADGYAAPWDGTGKRPIPPWPIPTKGTP
jgi:hypothetical protein